MTNAYQTARQQRLLESGNADFPDYGFATYVDATGVGQPVVDVLAEGGLTVVPVYFTHGDRRTEEAGRTVLGKAWLVSRLQALFQTGRIKLPAGLAVQDDRALQKVYWAQGMRQMVEQMTRGYGA